MVLSAAAIVTTGPAAIVLTVLATIFSPILAPRRLVRFARRGGGNQDAGDEQGSQ
jgi:hypothetical protein